MEFKKGLRFRLENRQVKVLSRSKEKNKVFLTCSVLYDGKEKTKQVIYLEKDMKKQLEEKNIKFN